MSKAVNIGFIGCAVGASFAVLVAEEGLLAVEMEAAALYAFAEKRGKPVICFAHVTNRMAQDEGDFEKGEADGTDDALALIECAVRRLVAIGYS